MRVLYTVVMFFAAYTGWSQTNAKNEDPIVGKMESITYRFKDSPVLHPKNYEIVVTEKDATIRIENYETGKLNQYSEIREIKADDWKEIVSLSGKLQEAKEYRVEGGAGYKSFSILRKNAGTNESYQLSWTSMSEDKVDENTKKLVEKIKSLTASYDEVLANQHKNEMPLLGGIRTFTFISSTPYPDASKNFEVIITPKNATVKYYALVDNSRQQLSKEREITSNDWSELVLLAGKLQAGENFTAPDGATGYQSFTLVKQNEGTPDSYSLSWTSMSEDNIDENTTKLVEKIRSLAPVHNGN